MVDSKEGWGKGEGWGQREGEGVVLLARRRPWVLIVRGCSSSVGRGLFCPWAFVMRGWRIVVYGRGIIVRGGS